MPIYNKIKSIAHSKGDDTNYQFWKRSGLSQSTAYRIYRDPTAYPAANVLAAICKAYNIQPGDCLEYVPEAKNELEK